MLHVEQITSELARLPDNALQRYAMMHKDDPYVLSLAMSESNRRKEMRSGAHMQPQPQPTVAQQAIAGMAPQPAMPQGQPMLPEQVGIGALPAPNIQRMAGGGIIGGMDDPTTDGQLEYNNEPVLRMADGGVAEEDYDASPLPSMAWEPKGESAISRFVKWAGRNVERDPETGEVVRKTETPAEKPVADFVPAEHIPASQMMYNPPAATNAPAAPTVKPPAPAPARVAAPAPAAIAPTPQLTPEKVMSGVQALLGSGEPAQTIEERLAAKAKYLGEDPTAVQMARLDKLSEAAAKEKDEARGIALLKAGLGMMASRSPYAMVGIGEGAQAGLADYSAALKDLKAAERERDKMRMDLERAAYARKDGDWDKAEAATEKAKDRDERRKEHIASAYTSIMGVGMQGETSRDVANIHGLYGLRSAQISAAAHDPLALYRVLGKGDPAVGYAIAKQDPLRAQMTEKWSAQAYPTSGMPNEAFIRRYPTPETYFQEAITVQGGGGGGGGGAAPVVRPR